MCYAYMYMNSLTLKFILFVCHPVEFFFLLIFILFLNFT